MLSRATGTKIYKFLAERVAKRLSKFDAVLGIYGRRSLASGEIVFGKSDIDLTILIDYFREERREAVFLCDLCDTYSRIKKLLPILGECNIFNDFDIRVWYSLKTYEWLVDRNWIRLYGKEIDLPEIKINKDDILFKFLWWVFESLFVSYKKKRVRSCFNILLELSNGYFTYTGAFDKPKLKREHVLEYLIETNPICKELRILQHPPYKSLGSENYRHLDRWIYQESLKLCDKLYDQVPKKLEGEVKCSQIFSHSPPDFLHTKYIIIKALTGKEIENGLNVMENNQEAVVITDKLLNLYLYYYNPWEYYAMMRTSGPFGLSEPPAEAMRRYVIRQANKSSARYIGLINKKYDLFYNLISQCRLYTDYDFISKSEDELKKVYKLHYGDWPFGKHTSRSSYFAHDYPILLEIIEDIYKKTGFIPLKSSESRG